MSVDAIPRTIEWIGGLDGYVLMIDQTRLPGELVMLECRDVRTIWDAIKRLCVRGAPAIGIAAAMGAVLGVRDYEGDDRAGFVKKLNEVCDYLASSRPTAVNLRWALDRIRRRAESTPKKMLEGRTKSLTLNLYGRRDRVRMADTVGRAYAVPDRPLRIVAVYPTTGGRGPRAFYSTKTDDSGKDLLTRYAMRWSIEEANQNSKGHLGFEEPQGWTPRAVERTAPSAMLLYSLLLLWFAQEGHRHYQPPHAPWHRSKSRASFADMLATLRRESVREHVSSTAPSGKGCRKLIRVLFHAVQQAA